MGIDNNVGWVYCAWDSKKERVSAGEASAPFADVAEVDGHQRALAESSSLSTSTVFGGVAKQQTRTIWDRVPAGLRVQIPPSPPSNISCLAHRVKVEHGLLGVHEKHGGR